MGTATSDVTLEAPAATGEGFRGSVGTGSAVLFALVVSGVSIPNEAALPAVQASGTGVSGNIFDSSFISIPKLQVTGAGAHGVIGAGGTIQLPALQVSAQSGGFSNITLGAVDVTGTGVTGASGRATITLPSVASTGAGTGESSSSSSVELPAVKAAGAGLSGGEASSNVTLPRLAVSGEGARGVAGTGSAILGAVQVSGSGLHNAVGTSDVTLPAILAGGSGEGTLTAPAADPTTGDAVENVLASEDTATVYNLGNYAATTYRGFRFNSFANQGSTALACKADGIYTLTGETDDGTAITSSFTLPIFTISRTQSRPSQMWLNYRSEKAVDLYLTSDDMNSFSYLLAPAQVNGIYRNRVKFGKGLRGTNYQARMSATGRLEIESIEFEAVAKTRRT